MRSLIPMFLAAAAACQGATLVSVTFTPDTLTGVAGDVVHFSGTLENISGGTAFITGDSLTFPLATDDTPFFSGPVSLGLSETSDPFTFFDVLIPLGQTPGIFDGVFTVIGGSVDGGEDVIGSANFHLDVQGTAPEPGSWLLMAFGAASLAARSRRHRRV